ncbi:MAG: double-strand break repair helicase AddA [Pseudomonadota bacterium]
MTQDTVIDLQINQKSRPVDPNVRQNQASNPTSSVWVSASAGSGKTKVLTDRILRLLLPHANDPFGCDPSKILAITFTKAAANEMAVRIQNILSDWATIPEEKLKENLESLLAKPPSQKQINTARKLFADILDVPGGLKIMTIHSFCQSILGRFPLEAGLSPNFQAVDENESSIVLKQAIKKTLQKARGEKGSPLSQSLTQLALFQNESQFEDLIQKLMSERRQVKDILKNNFGLEGLYTNLYAQFDIPTDTTTKNLYQEFCNPRNFDEQGLRLLVKALAEASKSFQREAITIQAWLDCEEQKRIQKLSEYKKAFLTNDNNIRKRWINKNILDTQPELQNYFENEALRLQKLEQDAKEIQVIHLTTDLFRIGSSILEEYENLKSFKGILDYDDLILKTLALLKGETDQLSNLDTTPWIRYKLDQGIDHILLDEAQDTNPEQWEIIRSLSDDFFDHNDQETSRTLFVVGDEKQSIYSFQRASPEKFNQMRLWFSEKIKDANKPFNAIDFITSFRSTPTILNFVDRAFQGDLQKGVSDTIIHHESSSTRRTQPGIVELWPLFEEEKLDAEDPWKPPTEIIESQSSATKMANYIAVKIQSWIKEKRVLYSYDRPVEPKDILILVRSRTAFMTQLVRSLKQKDIPVSGVDRMQINNEIVVEDLMAAAQFGLLPNDDLTLACLLKSPFIGISEEILFELSYCRKSSLWSQIKQSEHKEIYSWLNTLITKASKALPYEFFSWLLENPCPANTISGLHAIQSRLGEEAIDPLDEFLSIALKAPQNNLSHLQEFLVHQQNRDQEIKRELEDAGNMVRIMTVHGAKGLQAPIVILPDTIRNASSVKKERILWPQKTNKSVPYFFPRSDLVPQSCQNAYQKLDDLQHQEYRRLFYVATTRAESELYIGGYKGSKKPLDESWYHYAQSGFENSSDYQEITDSHFDSPILQLSNPPSDKPDRVKERQEQVGNIVEIPEWIYQKMPSEPNPPTPLMPSRPSGSHEEKILSPLVSTKIDENKFKRGNIIHKLLQFVPDNPKDQWEEITQNYLALPSHRLSNADQQQILKEVMMVLKSSEFAPIFGKGSKAEVPITGMLDDKTLISGQIDRLFVTENDVYIIDYKTNRPPPKDVKDVPKQYLNQMNAYEKTLKKIYPNHDIHKALFWTNEARLMVLPSQ